MSIYIEHMVYAQGYSPVPYVRELPDGGINLVIELVESTLNTVYTEAGLKGKYLMKNAWITGMQPCAIVYENQRNSAILSTRFTTGGFSALTSIPITEISHAGLEAELLLGNSFKDLYQKLINSNLILEKFLLMEEYFLSYPIDDKFESSVVKFLDKNIEKPIDWLIGKTGYSQKHVIHLTKKHTGFSPKYLQRLKRFQNTIKAIHLNKDQLDWTALTYAFDYFDQAHFIKEFSHFSGLRPTEYIRSQFLKADENQPVIDMVL